MICKYTGITHQFWIHIVLFIFKYSKILLKCLLRWTKYGVNKSSSHLGFLYFLRGSRVYGYITMTIRRMVVKDLLLNTVLTAKHHLGLLLFLSHRKEQTNDVTVYYNKRRNGYLCDFFFRSNPFCAIFDAYKRRKMHWNTNEICRCFLQDIGHNIAIVFGYRQFVSRFFLLTMKMTFLYAHQILFLN